MLFLGSFIVLFPHKGNKLYRRDTICILELLLMTHVFGYKVFLCTAGGSIFLLIGVLGMGLYGSNEPTLDL
uniref:NADH-plastoquinone oxidoreductase subunit 4 n=1 Tax=Cypripedium debile TaxID=442462 RepID=UPI002027A1EE|nr:NADH-plastoquinone oxidoreductase subunit 4 [Cypripedium debile]UPQ44446.1 NADH-plastoquinone oxidoreductase subunit 4 [Cypripedium debile]